jgi:hypothetical protein
MIWAMSMHKDLYNLSGVFLCNLALIRIYLSIYLYIYIYIYGKDHNVSGALLTFMLILDMLVN